MIGIGLFSLFMGLPCLNHLKIRQEDEKYEINPRKQAFNHRKQVKNQPGDINLVNRVRESAYEIMEEARFVSIDEDRIDEVAKELALEVSQNFPAIESAVSWDSHDCHYYGSPHLICQFVFVLDSLNFCFWPEERLEYEHLSIALREVFDFK